MDKGFQKCIWYKGWDLPSEIEYDNVYYYTRYLDSLEVLYSDRYCTNLWFGEAIEWMDEREVTELPVLSGGRAGDLEHPGQ